MMRGVELLGRLEGPALRVRLLPVAPESVVVRPAPAIAERLMPRWVAAMTLPRCIYVRASILAGDREVLARLIAHELVHARQWKTLGVLGFLGRYVGEYLRGRWQGMGHRAAYEAISLEAEARAIIDLLTE